MWILAFCRKKPDWNKHPVSYFLVEVQEEQHDPHSQLMDKIMQLMINEAKKVWNSDVSGYTRPPKYLHEPDFFQYPTFENSGIIEPTQIRLYQYLRIPESVDRSNFCVFDS